MRASISAIAAIFNLSIGAAKRRFRHCESGGTVDIECVVEWMERHSSDSAYPYWIRAIDRLENKIAKEIKEAK